jgi:NADH:ubiquinone oxidoreductase subunit B-like Fe-S oxidoreductase
MMAFLLHPMVLFAFGNLKRDLGLLWAWLCHRSFWQLTTMAACIYIGVQHFELIHSRHEATKWHGQFTAEKRHSTSLRLTFWRLPIRQEGTIPPTPFA